MYIKDQLQGRKNSRKSQQRNKRRENNNRFKKLKLKKEKERGKKKKENAPELQKSNIEAEVYNNSKKCD